MQINIQVFGMLTEVMGGSDFVYETSHTQLFQLQQELKQLHPKLNQITCKWAVNRVIVVNELEIKEGDEITIFPPFSGG